MLTRSISGLVFLVIVIGSLYGGYYTSIALFSVISFLGSLEFYKLAKKVSVPYKYLGSTFSSSIVILGGYLLANPHDIWVFGVWIFIAISFVIILLRSASETAISDISITLAGAFYLAIPLLSLLVIGIVPSFSAINFNWILPLFIFILTWVNDIGAYLVGRTFGKHKLFIRVSPNKTWEGSIGGLLFSVIFSILIHHFWPIFGLTTWLTTGVLVSVFANIGDLMESAFKRNAKVKDSGNIMPGHGGILDRFDAILLTAPIVLAYLLFTSEF